MVNITAPTTQQLNALVAPYLDNQQTGLAIAIGYASPQIAGDFGIYLAGSLLDQYWAPMALDNNTPFQIASASKPFTATLYTYLLGGYGNQNPTLADFFTGRIGSQFYGIAIADLLNYTSGLPQDNVSGFGPPWLPQPYTLPGLCGFLSMTDYQPVDSGGTYTYSNLGFALAAAAAQQMAGEPLSFIHLMEKYVFSPLGLGGTTYFGRTDLASLPLGFVYAGGRSPRPAAPGGAYFPAYNGAGGIVTTPNDMLAWLVFNMGISQNEQLTPLLPTLQTPSTTVTTNSKAPEKGARLCPGWFLSPLDAPTPTLQKDGGLPGWNSFIQFLQSDAPGTTPSQAGVFVLINASGITAPGGGEVAAALAGDVLALMQGHAPPAAATRPELVGRLPGI